jgi:ribosomal protein S27E
MDFFSFCEGIYPFKCDVEGCETALTSPYKLKEHKEVHDNARRFSCELCGRLFKQKKGVKRHMTFHMDPRVECEVCGKMLRRK